MDVTFNCLNVIHMYNFGMGSVNVAYQLYMQYIPDHWILNKKWWWSIFIWGLGGAAKNSYLIYRKTIIQAKRNKMYQVPNEMIHLQSLEYMSTHITTLKKSKQKQLRNTSSVAATSGNKDEMICHFLHLVP